MRLLVLGGTVFLGRAAAAHAVALGHEVTCAARGTSGAVPQGARLVPVDRAVDGGLSALTGDFDAVIDVARHPSYVRRALAQLGDRVGHWTFVSSGSVYADHGTPGATVADSPVLPAAPPEQDDPNGEAYGPCKVACEEAYAGGARAFICRAGLIVGPGDPSGRFTYWVARFLRGGDVLAPGAPTDRVQFVDVRDLAAWLVEAGATGLTGVFDGIAAPMPRAEFLARVAAGVAQAAPATPPSVLHWRDQETLTAHDVQPWMGDRSIPLWLPLPQYAGFMSRDVSASLAAGLTARPLAQTARDTADWLLANPGATTTGLTAAQESDVILATPRSG